MPETEMYRWSGKNNKGVGQNTSSIATAIPYKL